MVRGRGTCIEIESNTRLQLDDDFLIAQKPRWLKCLQTQSNLNIFPERC